MTTRLIHSSSRLLAKSLQQKRQKTNSPNSKEGYEDKDQLQKYEVNEAQEAQIDLEKTDSAPDEKQVKGSDVVRTKGYTDQCTANSEDIRKFFSDVGGVASIRILHDRNTGKSRNLGISYTGNAPYIRHKEYVVDHMHDAEGLVKSHHVTVMMGLAYVDFYNKEQTAVICTRLSIAGQIPNRTEVMVVEFPGNKKAQLESASKEYVETHNASGSQEAPQTATLKSDDNIQFKGKNIFAVPRNVRTLGLSANKLKTVEEGDEKPKSNDEFRKIIEALGIIQNCLAKLKHKRRPPM
ncbi:hypothetical protein NC651_012005 [Populus alba x Populus x berolinensis]|nr:hypothetical protein NC651_012005 [Populus alba x Populus x berolinensis]